jgi:MFS family permease
MNSPRPSSARLLYTLSVLLGINTLNFFDRQILGAVAEGIKKDWDLSDGRLGALGTAFILLYAVIGLPLGRWADVGQRSKLLAGGVALWSLMTAASGFAWNFWSLFTLRLGVGVGEASCAPAANSLLGDLFPLRSRSRAVAVFMLGLPLGLALSFIISGQVADQWGWRAAFWVAGVPGLLLALLALALPDPARGEVDLRPAGAEWSPGRAVRHVLSIPTMWWIILSGALHNFNMYAVGQFLSSFLQRFHGLTQTGAGWISGLIYGCGGLGILLGGWACDRAVQRHIRGRLVVATAALLLFVPSTLIALRQPAGNYWGFALWFLPGYALSYVYYSAVYATLQDIVEPALRGTAMALYFCAMYLLGAALGPVLTGWVSDTLARRAAAGGATAAAARTIGLHQAMYLVPTLGALLVVVLFAASRTVTADYERLAKRV